MPALSRWLFVFLLLLFPLVFPLPLFAATKAGINIADHYGEIDSAARVVGSGGWLYTMMCPGNTNELGALLSHTDQNIMLRGHYPGTHPIPELAKAWVKAIGEAYISHPNANKLYFMPVNEPNYEPDKENPQNVVAYTDALIAELDKSGLRGKTVVLLSPALNIYTLADEGGGYARQLGGEAYFTKFDGVAMNLYGQFEGSVLSGDKYVGGSITNAPYKRGFDYNDALRNLYGLSRGMDVYAVESGAAIVGATPFVQYAPAREQLFTYYENVVHNAWSGGSNLKMFSIFSYSPEQKAPDYQQPWIYSIDGSILLESKPVVDAMKAIDGGQNPERANFDATTFNSWLATTTIDPKVVSSCGGGGGGGGRGGGGKVGENDPNLFKKGQVYSVNIQRFIWQNNLTLDLTLEEENGQPKEMRFANKEYNSIGSSLLRARPQQMPASLTNLSANPAAIEYEDPVYAPVCKVELARVGSEAPPIGGQQACMDSSGNPKPAGSPCSEDYVEACSSGGVRNCHKRNSICDGAGTDGTHCSWSADSYCDSTCSVSGGGTPEDEDLKKIKVSIRVNKNFIKKLGAWFSVAHPEGRKEQAMWVPDQQLANEPVANAPLPTPDPLVANKSLESCDPDVFSLLDQAVPVPSKGKVEIGGISSALEDLIRKIFGFIPGNVFVQNLTVYFQLGSFLHYGNQMDEVSGDPKKGLPYTLVPGGITSADHGETVAPIVARLGNQKLDIQAVNNVQTSEVSSADQGCPAGSVCDPNKHQKRDTNMALYMLCTVLPGGFCDSHNIPINLGGNLQNPPGQPGSAPLPLPTSAPGVPGEPGVLTCTMDYRNPSIGVSDEIRKKEIDHAVATWNDYGLSEPERRKEVEDGWKLISDRAIAEGWSPAFALAIWIEESGASGVKAWDMGCISSPQHDLPDQLQCFLERPTKIPYNQHNPLTFEQFMCIFSEGHYPCEFTINQFFPKNLVDVLNRIAPGSCVPK